MSNITKRINRTVIITGHTAHARRRNKRTKKKIEKEIKEKPEEEAEKDLGDPFPNQNSLTPSLLILVLLNISIPPVFQNISFFLFFIPAIRFRYPVSLILEFSKYISWGFIL